MKLQFHRVDASAGYVFCPAQTVDTRREFDDSLLYYYTLDVRNFGTFRRFVRLYLALHQSLSMALSVQTRASNGTSGFPLSELVYLPRLLASLQALPTTLSP